MAEDGNIAPPRSKWNIPLFVFFKDARHVFKMDELGREILSIAFPAALALAADPIASLIDTAFIGRLGPVEIAAVGVSIAIFNQASRITIFPLVSITTSFVAEEDTLRRINMKAEKDENLGKGSAKDSEMKELVPADVRFENLEKGPATNYVKAEKDENLGKGSAKDSDMKELVPADVRFENLEKGPAPNYVMKDSIPEDDSSRTGLKSSSVTSGKVKNERLRIPSASTALVFGIILGLIQTIVLILGAKPLLGLMGVKSGSPMLTPALRYLTLRSLGAPAVLLSLALQGVFRGFKDTKTPLYATVAGDLTNIILDPILIFACHLGVTGAAISHVISQYLIFLILLWSLVKKVDLLPPSIKELQFSRFLKNGLLLLTRVIAVTFCVTLSASLAARLGSTSMAAFQICLQVWLTSSLLADGLAVAGQAILACAFAEKDYDKATAAATRVLQMGFVLGLGLAVVVGVGLQYGAKIFSTDVNVLHLISIAIPFVAATQPINSLAFVFDGVNFGASDFAYSAYSMVLVAIGSIASIFLLYKSYGFVGLWLALTIYMGLRTFAGFWRMGTGTGPWRFLRGQSLT